MNWIMSPDTAFEIDDGENVSSLLLPTTTWNVCWARAAPAGRRAARTAEKCITNVRNEEKVCTQTAVT